MLTHLAATLAGALAHLIHLAAAIAAGVHPAHVAGALAFATAPVGAPAGGGGDGGGDDDEGDDEADGQSIEDVGREVLKDLSAEEIKKQLSATDDDDEATELEGQAALDEVDAVDDDEDDDDDEEEEDDKPKGDKGDKGKGGKAEKPKAGAPKDDDAEGDKPEAVKVILPGIAARGEEDIEIEIDDKQVAERLRRLKNEVLRSRGVDERRAELEEMEAKLDAYQEQMEGDPITFHLTKLPVDKQIEVARALILEHLDALAPDIDKFLEDPAARADARIKLRDNMKDSTAKFETSQAVRVHAMKCLRAVEKLIPEGTDESVVTDFMADARAILGRAAEERKTVNPDTVPALLARRAALYGFDKKKSTKAAAGKPAVPDKPRAKPVSDKAREIAARKPAAAGAESQQARIRRTQMARTAGSRVAPAGAGAAPVQATALPPEAEADIASMSKHLRGQKLPETWSSSAD